jgi:hypothetical protein
MDNRDKSCTITESDSATEFRSSWIAECQKGSLEKKIYKFQFNKPNESNQTVLLDSSIKNSRGKMYMKKAFLGNYSGPCQQDTKKIPIENYLDLTTLSPVALILQLVHKPRTADIALLNAFTHFLTRRFSGNTVSAKMEKDLVSRLYR